MRGTESPWRGATGTASAQHTAPDTRACARGGCRFASPLGPVPANQEHRRVRRATACVYLVGHLIACASAIAWASAVYFSYALFTAWGWLLTAAAAWNGASRYHYYLLEVYEKKVEGAIGAERRREMF